MDEYNGMVRLRRTHRFQEQRQALDDDSGAALMYSLFTHSPKIMVRSRRRE